MFFNQLHDIAKRAGGSVTLTVALAAEEGKLTVVVMPKAGAGDVDPALATPLVLTGTADEFNSGFLEALSRYDAPHKSLAEQAEATAEVLKAAREAQAKKGAGAVRKATPAKPGNAAAGPGDDDDAGGDDEGRPDTAPAPKGDAVVDSTGDAAPSLFG